MNATVNDGIALEPVYVHFMPETLQPGRLYVSWAFGVAIHLCPCGCGLQAVTPLEGPEAWKLTEEAGRVTLEPSLLNEGCRTHYFIRDNRVVPA